MNIEQVLKNYGLSNEETRLYLAGLKLGEAPLARIAKIAGIKRSSAYLIAKNLEEKGLMGNFKLPNGLRFVASSPTLLSDQLKKRLSEVNEIIPELNAIQKNSYYKPRVTMYEGKEGYISIANESLKMNETIRAIGSLKKIYEIVGQEYDQKYYIPERIKNNSKIKALYFEKEVAEFFPKDFFSSEKNASDLREIKFLPADFYHPSFVLIYQNTVAIFTSKKELIAVKIESEEIAKSEKSKFDLIWSLTK
ncbi:MAG: helix-turn-helix domain-containing protein [Candidatus Moraniibacteriota bacterium]